MSNRKNPETSNEAYRSLEVVKLNERYKLILDALVNLGEGTTEEVAAYCRKPHEQLWKRFSELSNMGLIYRPGNKRLMKSGRQGYTWMLTGNGLPKTQEKNVYKKGQKALTDYTREITANSTNSVTISRQQELFPADFTKT